MRVAEKWPVASTPSIQRNLEAGVTIAHTASFAVGEGVDAHVYFELPPNKSYTPEQLILLARKLETMAELMRDIRLPQMNR